MKLLALAIPWLALVICAPVAAQGDPLKEVQRAFGKDAPRGEKAAAIGRMVDAVRAGRLKHRRAAKVVAKLLDHESSRGVELELVRALGSLDDPLAVQLLLVHSVDGVDSTVKRAAWDGLVKNPDRAVARELARFLGDRRWPIRAQAALVLCERGAYQHLDDLIDALKGEDDIAVTSAVGEALERLTLQVLPAKHEAWDAWREANPDWTPKKVERGSVGEGGDGDDDGPDPAATRVYPRGPQKPRAYGIVPRFEHFEIDGELVLVVVDVSTSMLKHGATSVEDARSLLKALPTYVEGLLLCFHENLLYLDEQFQPMTVIRKLEASDFLDSMQEGGATDFEVAVLAAVDQAEQWFEAHERDPRTMDIVIFSDGRSSRDRKAKVPKERVIERLNRLTNRRDVRLSFVASTGEANPFMIELAERSGGYLVLGDRPNTVGPLDR